MASKSDQLHIAFYPQPGHGHMIPIVDMARLFARHGVKATIIMTPLNATLFTETVQRDRELGFEITFHTIKLPSAEVGLPEGRENWSCISSPENELKFLEAYDLLREPVTQFLQESRPDCFVADLMFPWATDVASKFGIPRLFFYGTGCIALCVGDSLKRHEHIKKMASDLELINVPGLPHQIKMRRLQLPRYIKAEIDAEQKKIVDQSCKSELKVDAERKRILEESRKSELASYGVIVNSFYELEPAYKEHYSKVMGRRAWHVGPVSLCNKNSEDKAGRGSAASSESDEYLRWLDSKKPNSVLYISFGSMFRSSAAQLSEIAKGLEASGQDFIWVVRKEEEEEWPLEEFEKRMEGKGLIINGWAPQLLILDHEAVGGFMSHCGWNSTIESISAGVPIITWPFYTEQFCNEKLITEILRVGVVVRSEEWYKQADDTKFLVPKEDIQRAVTQLMVGEEAEKMRSRVRELKDMAKKAVEEGGSSYYDLNALLNELRLNRSSKKP